MRYKNIIIVSTSHIAKQSVTEVKDAFEKHNPDIVALELDPNRFQALITNAKSSLSIRQISQFGLLGYLFAVIGAFMQKKLGNIVGTKPGIEMITAIHQARKFGTIIFLIDQHIQVTLKKLSGISTKEKFNLLKELLFGWFKKEYIKIDLNKVPEAKLIEILILELKKKFPGMYKVLVSDRNKIMANNIIKIRKQNPDKKILVIIGAGHTKGIMKILKQKL